MHLSLKVCILLLITCAPVSSWAGCALGSGLERLEIYCLVNAINGERISSETAKFLDSRLQNEGYDSNFSLSAPSPRKPFKIGITPTLSYSQNINGGNPSKNLTLGNLSFAGDPSLVRKEGLLSGARLNLNGRFIYGEGRYLKYNLYAGYEYNVEHSLGVNTSGLSACSVNHISNWWYVDACANTSRVRKDITDDTNSNISITGSKVFTSGENSYSQMNLGVNRYFASVYTQNQVVIGLDTIHANSVYSAFDVTFGEAIENQLATRFSMSTQVTAQVANKPLTLSASYARADGGMLLGVERDETTIAVSASYPVWKNLTASVGYRRTDSSIDYFDVSTPTFGLQFNAIQF